MTIDECDDLNREAGLDDDTRAHCRRVAEAVAALGGTPTEVEVAALHDIMEDGGDVDWWWLRGRDINPLSIAYIAYLTRRGGETYAEYINQLPPDVRMIKVCDIRDNLTRGPIPGDLEKRYRRALAALETT